MNLKEAHEQRAKLFDQIEALEKKETAFQALPEVNKLAIVLHDYLCDKREHYHCGMNYQNPSQTPTAEARRYIERAKLILKETGMTYEMLVWTLQVGSGFETLSPRDAKAKEKTAQKRAQNPLVGTARANHYTY